MTTIAILLGAFILGTIAGSFVSVASHRLPKGQDIIFEPSHCPHCYAPLQPQNLVPLFSWIFQKGRCSFCHEKIHFRYPLIESLLGLTFVIVVVLYGVTFTSLLLILLATMLAVLIVTDLEEYIIPDSIQVVTLILGISYQIYEKHDLKETAASMVFGLVLGLILHYGYLYLRKKNALGFGDVKFLCVAGSWLAFSDFVPFLFFAGLIGTTTGIIWRMRKYGEVFPFGPALAVSLFINVLFPHLLERMTLL